jgi:hypothetical protein
MDSEVTREASMERCNPNVTRRGGSVTGLLCVGLFCVPLSSSLAGCVLGNDSDPPVLSVDLLWDRSAQNGRFSEGTCASANVVWMEWQLTEKNGGRLVATNKDDSQDCRDGFDFVDVGPGKYNLTVMGYDDQNQQLWSSTCQDLVLERFDVLFQCKVDKSQP